LTSSFTHTIPSDPLPVGSRIACCVEYNGGSYSGWQTQKNHSVVTVQSELERALAAVAATTAPFRVHCAGRTDAGVHACGQLIHFDAPVSRSLKAWVLGTNTYLPDAVRVVWAKQVPADFHARFSALSRRYRYIIANTRVRPALLTGQVTWQRRPLDAAVMHEEAQCLLGEQDFSSFRAASCQANTAMRNIHSINVSRRGELVVIDVQANAFLHHMVRNIAGSLMAIGSGRQQAGWLGDLLAMKDRNEGADTAAPDGLYLVRVDYPEIFSLPVKPLGPLLLSN
jgi:tRNA pseudouridine38-40 synthase